jgi:hypothetical protein
VEYLEHVEYLEYVEHLALQEPERHERRFVVARERRHFGAGTHA